jgi:ribose transport system permease protein
MLVLNENKRRTAMRLLQGVPLVVFIGVVLLFGCLTDRFLDLNNFVNIIEQTVPVAILAIGMTFVLLTAGIDLAVGSTMYLSVVAFGYLIHEATPLVAFLVAIATGAAVGCAHGIWVAWLRVPPFIVTLATLHIIRGVGRAVTHAQGVSVSERLSELNRAELLGVPLAVWILFGVMVTSWVFLQKTGYGRQIYAVGEDPEAALKAGLPVRPILIFVYMVCGLCAGIVGFISATQQGSAQPTFGVEMEFAAIAAAVLGGTSLFGGRGGVFGTLLGALLIKTLQNGLNIMDADPYVYPLVTGGFIFLAVLLDSSRNRLLHYLNRRIIIPGDLE